MPVPIPKIPFIPRRRHVVATEPPPPAVPVLVAVSFLADNWVDLTFDRAVDVSGVQGSAITIYDGAGIEFFYSASGDVTVLSPESVRLGLVGLGDYTGPSYLTASSGNGIV